MKKQKTQKSLYNIEGEKNKFGALSLSNSQIWCKAAVIKTVWVTEYTNRLMEQNRELINKPTWIWSTDIWQGNKGNTIEIVWSTNGAETTGHPHAKRSI